MLSVRKSVFACLIVLYSFVLSLPLTAQNSERSAEYPLISRITLNNDSVIYLSVSAEPSAKVLKKLHTFSFRENNIGFSLEPETGYEYRYQLTGIDKVPTPWTGRGFKEYTSLPAGHYSFNAWYRINGGRETELDPVSFIIRPLWYFSKLAIILYLVLVLLLIWVFYEHLDLRYARKQYTLEQIINKRTEDLILEKEKTEALLANVLPKNTADEIMAKGKATKIKYNFVTVLFSDIQGFTQIAEEMNPEVLIDELDRFFFHFDSVVETYRIEKIKTIGDAYMCAGGIPEKNRTNPVEVILAALEMQQYMSRLKESSLLQGMKYWDIRIGIHTGTVIAGVVGHKKLSYDIWGDTVNIASRMESSGEAGKINISGTTYEFVRDFFICQHRGKMPVKYKGELDMYFVEGIVPGLRDEQGVPNNRFRLKLQLVKLQDVEEVVNKIFAEEAPPNLYFHNSMHAKNISSHVDLIATSENLSEEEFLELKLASIFLITGFISDYEKPAEAALIIMDEILPRFGFEERNINSARRIISNSFSEKYESPADKIIHDVRYDYLGRADFIKLTDKLRRERNEHGIVSTGPDWIEIQKKLLRDHEFMTETGKILRSVSLEEQIKALEVYNK